MKFLAGFPVTNPIIFHQSSGPSGPAPWWLDWFLGSIIAFSIGVMIWAIVQIFKK
jgi:hypothetical protein